MKNSPQSFTIGALAKQAGVGVETVRYYHLAREIAAEKVRNIEARIDQLNKVADALRQLVHRCECGGQDMPCPIIRMALTP